MKVNIHNDKQFVAEIRKTPELQGAPLISLDVTQDLEDLVHEAYTAGVFQEALPAHEDELEELTVCFETTFSSEPIVEKIEVCLEFAYRGEEREFRRTFTHGRWKRSLQRALVEQEDELDAAQTLYSMLIALPVRNDTPLELAPLQAPQIADRTLSDLGVREFDDGQLDPERPVLVNRRLCQDSIAACLSSGSVETGRAVLGAYVRLPEPLPNTRTRIVTVMTNCIDDDRHEGQINEWKISPEAIAEAVRIAELRGLGERVLTVMHTHGWSNECGNCNENPNCPLTECTRVSLKDYQVLETLFPGKATLMPIVGRKLGVAGRRPVLEIHAWQGGRVKPLTWQQYLD